MLSRSRPHSTIGDYDVERTCCGIGAAQVWILKASASATRWATYSGPLGWHTGSIYYDEADAFHHVNATGRVVIIGQGNAPGREDLDRVHGAGGRGLGLWCRRGSRSLCWRGKAEQELGERRRRVVEY